MGDRTESGNVSILVGDGTLGWSAYAPYDAILVAAGGPQVPPPLIEQLGPNGRMLIPVGDQAVMLFSAKPEFAGEISTPDKFKLGFAPKSDPEIVTGTNVAPA